MDYKKLIKISDGQRPYIPDIIEVQSDCPMIDGASYRVSIYSDRWDTRGYFYCDAKGNLVLSKNPSSEYSNKKYEQVSKVIYGSSVINKFKKLARAGFPDKVYGIVCDPESQWQSVPLDIIKYPYYFDGKGYRNVM